MSRASGRGERSGGVFLIRLLVVLLSVVLLLGSGAADAAPRGQLDTPEVIRFWQQRIQNHPQGHLEYLLLGEALLRRTRETGDVTYLIQAEDATRQALQLQPHHRDAQALLSQVFFSLHRFPEALELAQPLADGSIPALATVADVQMALGNYDQAQIAYQHWADLKPSASLYSRQAALAEAMGDPQRSLQLLEQSAQEAVAMGELGEPLAWHEHQIGWQLWLLGHLEEAETHFQRALELYPHYYLAQAGLGRIYAARDDYPAAIEYFQRATEQIPRPDLLTTLGDLYLLTDRPEDAERCFATVDLIGELAQIQQQVYNRQLVYAWADHDRNLERALEMALAELQIRHDILGWDAAAWAYYKNGFSVQAHEAMEQALTFHTQNPILYYHAGLIAQALGHNKDAQSLLNQALDLNPHFDPLQSRHARAALQRLAGES